METTRRASRAAGARPVLRHPAAMDSTEAGYIRERARNASAHPLSGPKNSQARDGQGGPAAQEPGAHDAVAVGIVSLEQEGCSRRDGAKPAATAGLPEV